MNRLIKKLALLIPIPIFVLVFNYIQDPAQLFDYELSNQIALAMLDEQNFESSVSNYNERHVQRNYVQGLAEANDVIVLGSSRSLQINGALFPNQHFHNHSVPGATIEDLLAIYHLYYTAELLPDTIILGLDPWMLNANHSETRWMSLQPEYEAMMSLLGFFDSNIFSIETTNLHLYLELVSPSYFQASVEQLFKQIGEPANSTIARRTEEALSEHPIRMFDGTLTYPIAMQNRSEEEVRRVALRYVQITLPSFVSFREIDSHYASVLDEFVRFSKSQDIQVVFFLSPYHPEAYQRFIEAQDNSMLVETEAFYRELATRHDVMIIGSYNPELANCHESQFFDGLHPKFICLESLFREAISR